jgi:hypothetical protein
MPVAGLSGNGGFDRMAKYWPNRSYRGNRNKLLIIIYIFERCVFEIISRIKPRPLDYEFYKGTQWINITYKCVNKIFEYLKKYPVYIPRLKWTNCSDEIFFHTMTEHRDGLEIINESLRYINWIDGHEFTKIFRKDDY